MNMQRNTLPPTTRPARSGTITVLDFGAETATRPAPASEPHVEAAIVWSASLLSGLRRRDGVALAVVYAAESVLP